MPIQVTRNQVVASINKVLETLHAKQQGDDSVAVLVPDLDAYVASNPEFSCNHFAPDLLKEVCEIVSQDVGDLNSNTYKPGDVLPGEFEDGSFINISIEATENLSFLNHNFNIWVSGQSAYLIQVYINHSVPIVKQFSQQEFIELWNDLSNNNNWVDAYGIIFGVDPVDINADDIFMSEQRVTIVA